MGGLKKVIHKIKSNKGMSLVEVLLALGISVMLISLIALVISFSNRTLGYSRELIDTNTRGYDASYVLSRYVRESKHIAIDESGKKIIIQVPETIVGGSDIDIMHTLFLYVDEEKHQLCLDTNNSGGIGVIILAEDVTKVKFSIKSNGLGYVVEDEEGIQFYGFAYKRVT